MSDIKDYTSKFVEYYDVMNSYRDYEKESSDILSLLERYLAGPPNKLLDYGCGTGSHALELTGNGFEVYGYDPNPLMIKKANMKDIKLMGNWSYVLGRDWFNFDAIISCDGVINYLSTLKELKTYFTTIFDMLTRRGVFYFDCWNAIDVIQHPPSTKLREYDVGQKKIFRFCKPHNDFEHMKIDLEYLIYISDKKIVDYFQSLHHLKIFTPDVIEEIFDEVGFDMLYQNDKDKLNYVVTRRL